MPDHDTGSAPDNLAHLSRNIADVSQSSQVLSRTLTSAFDQIVLKGKNAGDVFNSLALSLSQMALKSAFEPLQQNLVGMVSNVFGGGNAFPFATGGIVQGGMPVPFASGGVIASPMAFPLGGGRTGIAGERGAEAIMPLTRGPDGRLGVAAAGASAGPAITINIAASDVESFRRSETQVAALLARAVAQGQRNL